MKSTSPNLKTFVPIRRVAFTVVLLLVLTWAIVPVGQQMWTLIKGKNIVKEFFIVDQNRLKAGAQTTTLNQLIPDFSHLRAVAPEATTPQKENFEQSLKYYQKITEYYPSIPEAYVFLGFCQAALGDDTHALSSNQKALTLNPNLFYAYYNLGILYQREGNDKKAAQMFQLALRIPPSLTQKILLSSKIPAKIKAAYTDAYERLQEITRRDLNNSSETSPAKRKPLLQLRIL